jgi:hypothetical protein
MVHLATEELDRGPVVGYCTYALHGPEFDTLWAAIEDRTAVELRAAEGEQNPLFRAIRMHGAAREPVLVAEVLRALADGRLRLDGRIVLDHTDQLLERGLDLSAEVDAAVRPLLPTAAPEYE